MNKPLFLYTHTHISHYAYGIRTTVIYKTQPTHSIIIIWVSVFSYNYFINIVAVVGTRN